MTRSQAIRPSARTPSGFDSADRRVPLFGIVERSRLIPRLVRLLPMRSLFSDEKNLHGGVAPTLPDRLHLGVVPYVLKCRHGSASGFLGFSFWAEIGGWDIPHFRQ